MNTVTWVFSGILAAIFAYSGAVKATMSRPRLLATGQTGIAPFPMPLVRVAISHASLREPKSVAANVTLLALASFVAASRFAALT